MDATQKKAFRKAFMGGFSKKDVNRYIEESSSKYTSEIKELKETLEAETKEKNLLSEKLSDAEEKLSELSSVKEELSSLQEKFNSLSSSFSEKEAEAAKLSEENASLSARISELLKTESEYTARKTELAEIEISARSRANELLSDTEREIDAKKASLEAELSVKKREFAEEKARASRIASDSVSNLSRLVSSLRGEVESIDSRLVRITDTARNNVSMLLNAVSDAETKVSNMGEVVSSFENK